MKIAINARFSGLQAVEGYARFTNGLIRGLASENPDDTLLLMYDQQPAEFSVIHGRNIASVVKGPPARHPLLWKWWYDMVMPRMAKQGGADVIFSPDGFCSLNTRIPQVLAIHDLAFIHVPEGISDMYRRYYLYFTPRFIRKARHIVTVSEFSRQDIIRHYPAAEGKISVVPNAADERFRPLDWKQKEEIKARYAGGQEYFLYVGSIHPRKNLIGLLKGFSWFKKWQKSNMKLVLAGRTAWGGAEFMDMMNHYKYRDDVIMTGYLPEDEIGALVGGAYALVYPSKWEGFGLPVLEAMQSGVPVITSSNSAMPEVAGNAAIYNDPSDHEGWGRAMGLLYKDETYRGQLVEAGLERAKAFSWKHSASLLHAVLAG